jgi:hypothetical protein
MRRNRDEAPEYVEGKKYSNYEMELMADELLRADSRSELCQTCDERGNPTGAVKPVPQPDFIDDQGRMLVLDYKELMCANGHRWHEGEGNPRSIQGENPILFEEHLASRRRREIYCTVGTPDPSIQQGIYHRTHPEGRPTNTPEQRKKSGASFYRG